MKIRTLALALALACGLTAIGEAKQKPGHHQVKATKVKRTKAGKSKTRKLKARKSSVKKRTVKH